MKHFIKKFFKYFGYKISRNNNFSNISSIDILRNVFDRKDDITIFDVGAHIGQSTKNYRQLFKNSHIYAFEPSPEAFKILKSLDIKNFKPFNFGFSNKKTKEEFYINSRNTATNSLLAFAENAKDVWGIKSLNNMDKIVCEFNTVDSFLIENKIKKIDFMKLDVQGAEYLVLDGAKDSLLKQRIKLIQMEVIIGDTYINQKSIGYYLNLFESYGYKLKIFSDNVIRNGVLVQTDLFFTI